MGLNPPPPPWRKGDVPTEEQRQLYAAMLERSMSRTYLGRWHLKRRARRARALEGEGS